METHGMINAKFWKVVTGTSGGLRDWDKHKGDMLMLLIFYFFLKIVFY